MWYGVCMVEVSGRINSTRFKNRLFIAVPDLSIHVSGKEVLLTYKNDIGTAITFACSAGKYFKISRYFI